MLRCERNPEGCKLIDSNASARPSLTQNTYTYTDFRTDIAFAVCFISSKHSVVVLRAHKKSKEVACGSPGQDSLAQARKVIDAHDALLSSRDINV